MLNSLLKKWNNMIPSDMFSLKGKVIIVTGGTGVLGASFVKGIAQQGGIPIILGQNAEKGNERVADIISNGGMAHFISANVLEEAQLIAAKNEILKKFGKIDGLVNGAGGNIPTGVLPPTEDVFNLNIEGMKDALVLNLWGTVIPVQVFGPEIAKTGNGSIVNISSVSSKRALTRVLGYSMGKAAIDTYTKWFAVEMANRYGDTIRMNSIMPGFFLSTQNKNLLTNTDGSYTDR